MFLELDGYNLHNALFLAVKYFVINDKQTVVLEESLLRDEENKKFFMRFGDSFPFLWNFTILIFTQSMV
jgi:hypothetical protein